jgi:hypothetical protein
MKIQVAQNLRRLKKYKKWEMQVNFMYLLILVLRNYKIEMIMKNKNFIKYQLKLWLIFSNFKNNNSKTKIIIY